MEVLIHQCQLLLRVAQSFLAHLLRWSQNLLFVVAAQVGLCRFSLIGCNLLRVLQRILFRRHVCNTSFFGNLVVDA